MNPLPPSLPWGLLALATAGGLVLYARRRRLETRLNQTQIMLRRISQAVESTSDAVGIGDMDGHSLYHNRAHQALFGYTVEELNAVPGGGVLFADKSVAREILQRVCSGRSWSGETDVLTKDGRHVPAFVRADIIRDESGQPVGIYGVFADITEQRRRAEERERASRLESLGMMASGIAHDFGNILTVLSGNLHLLRSAETLTPKGQTRVTDMTGVVERACNLTAQLKTFAKGSTPQKQRSRLLPLVREAATLATSGSGVTLVDQLAADVWSADVDPVQFGQVVHNIALNAVQAMDGAGRLTLRSANLPPGTGVGLPPDVPWVEIVIADEGPGIPPEVLPQIFDPFFTTKKSGTGLGLATSYAVVERHRGRLRASSQVGQGTSFHILLPAAV